MEIDNHEVRLYVIVRTDMDSMNPGRVAAQVSHAASQVAWAAFIVPRDSEIQALYAEWVGTRAADQIRGFGTTIVLDGGDNFNELCELGTHHGVVIDPTYPILDGKIVHLVNIPTCSWILARVKDVPEQIRNLPLYKG
jgi:hypothetical protein